MPLMLHSTSILGRPPSSSSGISSNLHLRAQHGQSGLLQVPAWAAACHPGETYQQSVHAQGMGGAGLEHQAARTHSISAGNSPDRVNEHRVCGMVISRQEPGGPCHLHLPQHAHGPDYARLRGAHRTPSKECAW